MFLVNVIARWAARLPLHCNNDNSRFFCFFFHFQKTLFLSNSNFHPYVFWILGITMRPFLCSFFRFFVLCWLLNYLGFLFFSMSHNERLFFCLAAIKVDTWDRYCYLGKYSLSNLWCLIWAGGRGDKKSLMSYDLTMMAKILDCHMIFGGTGQIFFIKSLVWGRTRKVLCHVIWWDNYGKNTKLSYDIWGGQAK